MSTNAQVPGPLRSKGVTQRLVRNKIWKPANRSNEHAMIGIVGREGKGKSHTSLKIGHIVDPQFTHERVCFDPADFIKQCRDLPPGSAIVLDEAGVGMGVRSWYSEEQIATNKLMQVIRDENLIGIFTLPNLDELDSQTRSRLHALIEMIETYPGEGYAVAKWRDIKTFPAEESKGIIKPFPEVKVNGVPRRVTRVSFTPPPADVVEPYEERKATFQDDLYEETLEVLEDDEVDEDAPQTPKEVAQDILDNEGVEEYVSVHGGNGTTYISWKLIRGERDLSQNDAKTVKTYLEREVDLEGIES